MENNNSKENSEKRNYGIDVLKIISMLYIVILHFLAQGGLLFSSYVGSVQYKAVWFMEILTYCAVDIFAIISGYVGYSNEKKEQKYSTWILLWLEVVFYGVVLTLIFRLINPSLVTNQDFFVMLFPVSNDLYWYFTDYTALFFVIPLLNSAVRGLQEKELKKVFITLFILFALIDNVINKFGLSTGYSFVWLSILYIMGAIMKKYKIGEKIKPLKSLIYIFLLVIITYLWKIYGIEYGSLIDKELFISYCSPTIVGMAILYVIMFSKIEFSKLFQKIIKFLAPGAFAIYILNCQRFIWLYVIKDRFSYLAEASPYLIISKILLFSVAFVILSLLIDKVRAYIFKTFKINNIVEWFLSKIKKRINERN